MAKGTCSVEDCGRPGHARGLCASHYIRQRTTGVLGGPIEPRIMNRGGACKSADCTRTARKLGLCESHYRRAQRTTADYPIGQQPKKVPAKCGQEGCTRQAQARDMCWTHYRRFAKTGSPDTVRPRPAGSSHPAWAGDDVGYVGAHQRVRKTYGSARLYPCVDCGGPAKQWSYDHACPNERSSDVGPYSTDVTRYQPRCVSCHTIFDLRK